MSFSLIYNQAAHVATSWRTLNYNEVDPKENIIAGPRSRMVRTEQETGAVQLGYLYSTPYVFDTIVVAGIHRMATSVADCSFRVKMLKSDGFTRTDVVATVEAALESADFVGIKGQDLIYDSIAYASTYEYGLAVETDSAATAGCPLHFSKFYACNRYSFGIEPNQKPSISPVKYESRLFRPIRGDEELEVEADISLSFSGISKAKIKEFLSIPHLLEWPIFIYDSDGDWWDHKLEHVIVKSYNVTSLGKADFNLSLLCGRLKHYE